MVTSGAWLRRVTPVSGEEKPDLARIGRVVEELFPEALGVWVYGSVAQGRARAGSDLDIAILPSRPIDLWDRHERAIEVGYRLGRDVDLVDLRRVSSVLRFEVVAHGQRVTARDPWACDLFETKALKDFQRLNEDQREHLAAIRRTGTL